jgi:thioredoxin reductase
MFGRIDEVNNGRHSIGTDGGSAMAIDQRPSIGTAILASRVPYQKGVYVVGPFAERVSFSSQQRRALSLVYSINSELKAGGDAAGLSDKRVCVVGAGLAGLASAVAVAGYGSRVWVLETAGGAMASMRNANHRDIHPSINFWPRETVTLTTALPFFNWFQDKCDNVVERILKQWQAFEGRDGIEGITPRCLVTDIVSTGSEWEIRYDDGPGLNPPPVTRCDIVIFAVGFGAENTIEGDDTPSYWDEQADWMEEIRKGDCEPPFDMFIVSGTGDGGLIEALRLLNLSFRAGSVDKRTESALRDAILADRLKQIESEVRKQISDNVLHRKFPLADNLKDAAAELLWDEYSKLSSHLLTGFRDAMREDSSAIEKVILLGRRSRPLEYSSSPYHRLLIMEAIRAGRLDYYQIDGEIEVKVASPVTTGKVRRVYRPKVSRKTVTFRSKLQISMKGGNFDPIKKNKHHSFDNCFFLGRHGTTSPLTEIGLFNTDFDGGPDEVTELVRRRQALYADQDWLSMDEACELATNLGLPAPNQKWDWLKSNIEDAQDFFFDRFGLHVTAEHPKAELIVRGAAPTDPEAVEGLPSKFFGIEVNLSRLTEAFPEADPSGHASAPGRGA